jgi:hypothetical protein
MLERRHSFQSPGGGILRASNRFALDYRREVSSLGQPVTPIFDFHTHVNGTAAALVWKEVAATFGVHGALTMVRLPEAAAVRKTLGDLVQFIAFPDFRAADRGLSMRSGYLDDIRAFHGEHGSKMIKLWNAPRLREYFPGTEGNDLVEFDGEWRVKHVELAQKLGMGVMVHIADPDTWFATKYADATKYGKKRDHYRGLEVMLSRFSDMPWVAAHMGGYAEDLDFLDGLLERHSNLSIDTSATKWVVREISRHPRERVVKFFTRWKGRVMFGSDIVTTDEHMAPKAGQTVHPMADLADSPESAFDLYASRYFALRMMLESQYEDESPIADPDLAMVAPEKHGPMDAPPLRGMHLPQDVLLSLYRDAAISYGAKVGLKLAQ